MKRLLASCALTCALALSASAGGTHTPGDDPCVPTPEAPCPEDDGSNSTASTGEESFFIVWINGVPIVIYY